MTGQPSHELAPRGFTQLSARNSRIYSCLGQISKDKKGTRDIFHELVYFSSRCQFLVNHLFCALPRRKLQKRLPMLGKPPRLHGSQYPAILVGLSLVTFRRRLV